ncbi:GcrA family cell cycle regulator [Pelagibius marinus]|uniref:GcrA family cell cycle regulator n=1 Tax=Pelagibius marinus TaxID=2762760 RepID=UPI001872B9A3|nr:GcrA family cell cycle regulator [Pelagibius marinus]
MTWTEERVAELMRLWEAGRSASEIGRLLGVSKNSVVGKAHRMKLKARPSPIKRGATPQVRRSAVAAMPKPTTQAPAAPKQVQERTAAPAPAPRPSRPVARSNGKGPSCLWPIGDPGDQDFHFCGEPAVPGKPYCDEHCARAYIVRNRSDSEAA